MSAFNDVLGRYQAEQPASKSGAAVWRRVWAVARPLVSGVTMVVLAFVFVMILTLPWVADYFGVTNVLHLLAGLFIAGAVTIVIRTVMT
jgi:membrane protein YdbS with pleckstrin-like domain